MFLPLRSRSVFHSLESLEPRRLFAIDVAIDANTTFQTIEGFGTAMQWSRTSPYDTPAFREMYYRDLGSSFLRIDLNINTLRGSDNNLATPVVMVEDLQTNINQFDFNYLTGGQNFGEVAQAGSSLALDELRLIGSIWTPPHWMKGPEYNSNGNLSGNMPVLTSTSDSAGGSLIDTPENLQQFGRYVAAFVKGFEQEFGVPMYAISIQNELAFHQSFNSCCYYPALYVKALKAVKAAFTQYGITTKIQGPEDVGLGSPNELDIPTRAFKFIDAVRNDPEAMAALDIYSTHGVMWQTVNGVPNTYRSPIMWDQYINGRPAELYPAPNWVGIGNDGKPSWMTETSGESGSASSNFRMLAHAFDALIYGNVTAWLYWQTSQGSTQTGETLTGGSDTTNFKYNMAKQLFRHVRPGAVRIGTSYSDPYGLYTIAFKHPENKTVTTILMNPSSTLEETVNLSAVGTNLSQFAIARRTSTNERFVDLGPQAFVDGNLSITLPPRSVVTLHGYEDQQISGTVYNDLNGNGSRDAGEPGIARRKVFNDTNGNGSLDEGEFSALTDPEGNYVLAGLMDGAYSIHQQIPPTWSETTGGMQSAALVAGESLAGVNFGSAGPAPSIDSFTFDVNASKPALRATFSTNVINSLAPNDPQVINLATGNSPGGNTSVTLNYFNQGTTGRWKLYNLPDGNYRATISGSVISDNDGTPASNARTVDFYMLAGDANRDRSVDAQDFNLLAGNFGNGSRFSQGDLNYDGSINSADFNLFITQYGKRLAPSPASGSVPINPAIAPLPIFTPPEGHVFSMLELLGE